MAAEDAQRLVGYLQAQPPHSTDKVQVWLPHTHFGRVNKKGKGTFLPRATLQAFTERKEQGWGQPYAPNTC